MAHGQHTYTTVLEELAVFAEAMKGTKVLMPIDLGGGAQNTNSLTIP